MTEAELLKLIEDGENIRVEFKKSTTEITKDVYDTVCSFSNREGGIILLGVKDNGEILGVAPDAVDRMKKDFATSINNGQKINPPLYLQPEACTVDGRTLLVIQVPSGSQVCRHHGRIFDRSHEADIDITDNSDMVYQLYARKSGSYFVNKVTRFQMEDLRPDLMERARAMTASRGQPSVEVHVRRRTAAQRRSDLKRPRKAARRHYPCGDSSVREGQHDSVRIAAAQNGRHFPGGKPGSL